MATANDETEHFVTASTEYTLASGDVIEVERKMHKSATSNPAKLWRVGLSYRKHK